MRKIGLKLFAASASTIFASNLAGCGQSAEKAETAATAGATGAASASGDQAGELKKLEDDAIANEGAAIGTTASQ